MALARNKRGGGVKTKGRKQTHGQFIIGLRAVGTAYGMYTSDLRESSEYFTTIPYYTTKPKKKRG